MRRQDQLPAGRPPALNIASEQEIDREETGAGRR
jgi:hypothetical protein